LTPSALAVSEFDVEANDMYLVCRQMTRKKERQSKAEIPSPVISPLNGLSINALHIRGETKNGAEKDKISATVAAIYPGKAKKTILTPGGFADSIIPATYVAETNLLTNIGHFRIRAYRINDDDASREPHPLGAGAGLGSDLA